MQSVSYYDHDFDWEEWAQMSALNPLPGVDHDNTYSLSPANLDWDRVFAFHNRGQLYKPRNYLASEFHGYISPAGEVLEIGSGYGSSLYAILPRFPSIRRYWATDCSEPAIDILRAHPLFDENRISTCVWDFSNPPDETIALAAPDVVLSIFALSASHPSHHRSVLQHIKQLLSRSQSETPHLLLRDYGLHDMTMYRHRRRIDTHTFLRVDSTIAHYFSLEELRELMEEEGFIVKELHYATVINTNRKENSVMHRVFVHGVFQLKKNDSHSA